MIKSQTFSNLAVAAALIAVLVLPQPAQAAMKDWQKGVSLHPHSKSDFASESFKRSLKNAANMHANMATFIVPYYQPTHNSPDIQPGWNTPTDQSLIAGIGYARELGMQAAIKLHIHSYVGDAWAAHINPQGAARDLWFVRYGILLNKYADIAQKYGVSQLVIGNELTRMTHPGFDSKNTERWSNMISEVRKQFAGHLTYNANWSVEKENLVFWDKLDSIGVSGYFNLTDDLSASWNKIKTVELDPVVQKFNKPLVFSEIGYRSVENAHTQPWNYTLTGKVDHQTQIDSYNALFSFWSKHDYMRGLNMWQWETDPNAGGANSPSYTVQNKPAQSAVAHWFKENSAPAPGTKFVAPETTEEQSPIILISPRHESRVLNLLTIEAAVAGYEPQDYNLYWQVGHGGLTELSTNGVGKSATVSVADWHWNSDNLYDITLLAINKAGGVIGKRTFIITAAHQ